MCGHAHKILANVCSKGLVFGSAARVSLCFIKTLDGLHFLAYLCYTLIFVRRMRKHVDCIATLAQLVERLTRNEKVAGPIPASGSDYLFTHSYSELLCASGGIGRRAGFRFLFHWSEGSSPFSRTLSCLTT